MITKDQIAAVKNGKPVRKPTARKKVVAKPVRPKKANGATIRIDRPRFCQELIKNSMNATAAYKAVSPKVTDKTAAANGHRLLREAETLDILTPLLEGLFVDAGIEAEYVFRRWLEIASGSAADYYTFKDGVPTLDMSNMTPSQRANLKSISINHTQHGTNYKIEVYDAQRAIDTIGKHLGLLVDKLAEEDVERIGDLIEKGVNRIRASKDLDGWRSLMNENGELIT